MSDTPVMIKIMTFGIVLNLVCGSFMLLFFPDVENNKAIQGDLSDQDAINAAFADFEGDMFSNISASGNLEDKGDSVYRVLDMFNLGLIWTLVSNVVTFMYGFIKLLYSIFGNSINQYSVALCNSIFGLLYSIVTISYAYGAIYLFTGRQTKD